MDKLPKEILFGILYIALKKSPPSTPLFRLVCQRWNICIEPIEYYNKQRISYFNLSAYYGRNHLLRFYYKLWYSNYTEYETQILLNKALIYAVSTGSACMPLLIEWGANNLDIAAAAAIRASRFNFIYLDEVIDYLISAGAHWYLLPPGYIQCRNRFIRE